MTVAVSLAQQFVCRAPHPCGDCHVLVCNQGAVHLRRCCARLRELVPRHAPRGSRSLASLSGLLKKGTDPLRHNEFRGQNACFQRVCPLFQQAVGGFLASRRNVICTPNASECNLSAAALPCAPGDAESRNPGTVENQMPSAFFGITDNPCTPDHRSVCGGASHSAQPTGPVRPHPQPAPNPPGAPPPQPDPFPNPVPHPAPAPAPGPKSATRRRRILVELPAKA
jgi:hypothetical protein